MPGIDMNYQTQSLRDMLAREYVLGTMTGRVRKRFERLLMNDRELKVTVNALQNNLYPLYDNITPIQPSPIVWRKIQERLNFVGKKLAFWSRFGFWRNFAVVNLCLSIALAVLLINTKPDSPVYMAVLSGENNQAILLAQAGLNKHEITIQAIAPIEVKSTNSLELWLIAGAAPPQSLGLLPASGKRIIAIPEMLQTGISANNILAVSLEPAGGSPTHQPTGPVLFKGAWRMI